MLVPYFLVFLVTTSAVAVVLFDLSDAYLLAAVFVVSLAAWLLRKQVFPYRLSCPQCGRRLSILSPDALTIYAMDDNLCDECRPASE
ncbi:MAG: hypothetical protein ACOCU9_00725 [Spirochaetota bacterium]